MEKYELQRNAVSHLLLLLLLSVILSIHIYDFAVFLLDIDPESLPICLGCTFKIAGFLKKNWLLVHLIILLLFLGEVVLVRNAKNEYLLMIERGQQVVALSLGMVYCFICFSLILPWIGWQHSYVLPSKEVLSMPFVNDFFWVRDMWFRHFLIFCIFGGCILLTIIIQHFKENIIKHYGYNKELSLPPPK